MRRDRGMRARMSVLIVGACAVLLVGIGGLGAARAGRSSGRRAHPGRVELVRAVPSLSAARAQSRRGRRRVARGAAARSRRAYRDLSAARALALARRRGGAVAVAAASFYEPLMLRRGERVVRYVNPREAIVSRPRSSSSNPLSPVRTVIAQSTGPMEAGVGANARRVNLDLASIGPSGVAPIVSNAPFSATSSSLTFPREGVSVELVGASARAFTSVAGGKEDFAASVLPSTDEVVQATTVGAEQSLQMRSAQSPSAFKFRFSIPAGDTLAIGRDGAITVSDGQSIVVYVAGPAATDANGDAVPSRISLSGDVLTIDVDAAADPSAVYPLTLDPAYITDQACGYTNVQDPYNYIDSECGDGSDAFITTGNPETWAQWHYTQSAPFSHATASAFGSGLIIGTTTGVNYAARSAGEYYYQAPPGAFIFRADFVNTSHTDYSGLSSDMFMGLYDATDSRWETESGYEGYNNEDTTTPLGENPLFISAARTSPGEYVAAFNSGPLVAHNGDWAVFGLQLLTAGARSGSTSDIALTLGATVWLGDVTPPTFTSTVPASSGVWADDADKTYSTNVDGEDNGVGMKTVGALVTDETTGQVSGPPTVFNACTSDHTGAGYCPMTPTAWGAALSYQLPEGADQVQLVAGDALGNFSTQTYTAKIDRSPPTVALDGSLYSARDDPTNNPSGSSKTAPLTGLAYPLDIAAHDPDSGVAEIDVSVDGGTSQVFDGDCITTPASSAGCDTSDVVQYEFDNELYPAGLHTITVTAKDWLGTGLDGQPGLPSHVTTQTFQVYTAPAVSLGQSQTPLQSDTLGLESFYRYRTVPTGAGTSLSINEGTGNAVWAWTPISDPGQGLASFVQVTYNSQQRLSGLDVLNRVAGGATTNSTGYDQAGSGWSIGVDGLTRLNEPLDLSQLPAGQITFTDIDGTAHTFLMNKSSGPWTSPPGVFLHLRQWQAYTPSNPSTFNRVWAITRPDGVTFFFDALGYESGLEDRVGNQITFHRQFVTPVNKVTSLLGAGTTATICMGAATATVTQVLGAGCGEQTTSVTDQNARAITISYVSSGPGFGKIASVTDHAGRVLQFTYDSTGSYLDGLSEPNGLHARAFNFNYGGPGDPTPALAALAPLLGVAGANAALLPMALTSIEDPRAVDGDAVEHAGTGMAIDMQATTIAYAADQGSQPSQDPCPVGQTSSQASQEISSLLDLEPVCVTAVGSRDGGKTVFSYSTGANASGNPIHTTVVTGPQTDENGSSEVWTDTMDDDFRPVKDVDPLGRETDTVWNNIGGSPPGNTIAQLTTGLVASGSTAPAPVVTTYGYDANGMVTDQQGPAAPGQAQDFRETQTTYQASSGPSALQAPSGADSGGAFVEDETEQQVSTGTGTVTTSYTLDPSDPADGLVTAVAIGGQTWKLAYYPGTMGTPGMTGTTDSGGGLIRSETDPMGNATEFGNANGQYSPLSTLGANQGYDPNGLPELVYAPSQTVASTYQYDDDGDLLALSDPRTANPVLIPGADMLSATNPVVTSATPRQPYTTYTAYDQLGQQTGEWIPKDTGPTGSNAWIYDSSAYDENGNVIATMEGNDGSAPADVTTTNLSFTPMDEPASQAVLNVPGSEASLGTSQTTTRCYDLNGNETDEVLPRGQSTAHSCTDGLALANNAPSGQDDAEHEILDADGEVLVDEQVYSTVNGSTGGPARDQLTGYAFDARGNRIGVSDPADNAGAGGWMAAAANAASATSGTVGPTWRTHTVYDAADQAIDTIENPDASNGTIDQTLDQYDATGALVATEDPDAVAAVGGAPNPSSATGEYQLAGVANATTNVYNARGLLSSVTDPDGDQTQYARQADGKICAIISPDGSALGGANPDKPSVDCSASTASTPQAYKTVYSYTPLGGLSNVMLPTAPGEYSYQDPLQVSYTPNLVGDPVSITDPDGQSMTNTFYDTGDLKSTTMPWWWTYDPAGSGSPGPDPNTGGQGQLAAATPDEGLQVRQKTLSEIYQQDASSSTPPALPSDGVSGNLGQVASQSLPGILPDAGATALGYDGHMWLTSVTDAEGVADGVGSSAAAPYTTSLAYDPGGNLLQSQQPFSGVSGGAKEFSTTSYTYDPDGNTLSETTPGRSVAGQLTPGAAITAAGVAATAETTSYSYDGLDRVSSETTPGAAGVMGGAATSQPTQYCYYLAPTGGQDTASATQSSCPADNGSSRLSVSEPGGVSYTVAQRVLSIDPESHARTVDYDGEGNELASTDPLGNVTSHGYDPDGNQTVLVRPSGNTSGTPNASYATTSVYDDADRLTSSTDGTGNTTRYTYDANGNTTQVDAPGAGTSAAAAAVDQVTDYAYNGRGLLWKTTTGAGSLQGVPNASSPGDGQSNARTTVTETDGNGNVVRTVEPAGVNPTGATYHPYDQGYTAASADDDGSANIDATIQTYDASNQLTSMYLPWGCDLSANTAKASCSSGQATATDPRQWRTDYTRTNPSTTGGDWAGSVTQAYVWNGSGTPTKSTTSFSYFPNGWIEGQTSPQMDDMPVPEAGYTTGGGTQQTISYGYDADGEQTYESEQGTGPDPALGRSVWRSYWPDGQLQQTDGQGESALARTYEYYYKPTGPLSELNSITTNAQGGQVDGGELDQACYDPAGRVTAVDQTLNPAGGGSAPSNDTAYAYDADGNEVDRLQNGTFGSSGPFSCPAQAAPGSLPAGFSGGQESQFAFTDLDQEKSDTVMPDPTGGAQQPARTFTTSYWPSGAREQQTRSQTGGTGSVQENWYDTDSGLEAEDVDQQQANGTTNQSSTKDQTYSYDTDSNRTSSENGTHLYNALNQEVQWTRGATNTANSGSVVNYTYDGDGDMLQQHSLVPITNATVAGVPQPVTATQETTTQFCSLASAATPTANETANTADTTGGCSLDSGRPESIETYQSLNVNGGGSATNQETTQQDCYDSLGQMTRTIKTSSTSASGTTNTSDTCPSSNPTPQTSSLYTYNVFGQQIASTVPFASTTNANQTLSTANTYDALSRRVQSTSTLSGQAATPATFNYLGLSEQDVSQGQGQTANGTAYTNTDDYSSAGNPIGLYTPASNAYYSYQTDANGSITGLEDNTGTVQQDDAYHYTPQGELELGANETGNTLSDQLGNQAPDSALNVEAQANQTLFEGFQYNPGGTSPAGPGTPNADSYSLPARNYLPGQDAYASPDTFEQSTAEQNVNQNPTTQGVYTFAAGNPTTNIELDGHYISTGVGVYLSSPTGASNYVEGANGSTGTTIDTGANGRPIEAINSSNGATTQTAAQAQAAAEQAYGISAIGDAANELVYIAQRRAAKGESLSLADVSFPVYEQAEVDFNDLTYGSSATSGNYKYNLGANLLTQTGDQNASISDSICGGPCPREHVSALDLASLVFFAFGPEFAPEAADVDAAISGAATEDEPAFPEIKPGSSGGPTAGKPFPQSVRQAALEENPSTCVFCHLETDSPQVDHAIPRANGGNATLDNAQTSCPFCNASKGARPFPVNPPPGYEGPFPPPYFNPSGPP